MKKFVQTLLIALAFAVCVSVAYAAPVDINTANAEEISKALEGIGLKKAEAIVAYRTQNGKFKSVNDLAAVKGIGEKTVEKNRQNLTVTMSKSQ